MDDEINRITIDENDVIINSRESKPPTNGTLLWRYPIRANVYEDCKKKVDRKKLPDKNWYDKAKDCFVEKGIQNVRFWKKYSNPEAAANDNSRIRNGIRTIGRLQNETSYVYCIATPKEVVDNIKNQGKACKNRIFKRQNNQRQEGQNNNIDNQKINKANQSNKKTDINEPHNKDVTSISMDIVATQQDLKIDNNNSTTSAHNEERRNEINGPISEHVKHKNSSVNCETERNLDIDNLNDERYSAKNDTTMEHSADTNVQMDLQHQNESFHQNLTDDEIMLNLALGDMLDESSSGLNDVTFPMDVDQDSSFKHFLKRTIDDVEQEPWRLLLSPFVENDLPRVDFLKGTREWILQIFNDWIESTTANDHGVMILAAPAGFGKTQIAYQIVDKYFDDVIGWHFFKHDYKLRNNPKRMMLSLTYQLADKFHNFESKLNDIVVQRKLNEDKLKTEYNTNDIFAQLLKDPLTSMELEEETKKYVIVLDALDECEKDGKNEFIDCIKKYFGDLPSWVKVLITTRPEYPMMKKLALFNPIEIRPSEHNNNMNDINFFFTQIVLNQKKCQLSNDVNANHIISKLVEKSEGLFMVARFLVNKIQEDNFIITLQNIENLPNGTEEFYVDRFQSIIPNDTWSENIAWKVLEVVVVAKQPMSLDHIGKIMKCNLNVLKKAIEKLSLFLIFTNSESKTATITPKTEVSVCHKSLTDWLTCTEREMDEYYVDTRKVHKVIATYCIDFLKKEQVACSDDMSKFVKLPTKFDYESSISKYIFQYGVQHLVDAGMLNEVRRIVLNIGWIILAVQMKHPYEVTMDYQLLEHNNDDLVMHLIGRCISMSSNAIRKYDWRQLPSQIVGRLYDSIVKRASNDPIHNELLDFTNRVKNFSYNFTWWCPLGPTWEQAEDSCLKVFNSHKNAITLVLFNPDGTLVVSCDHEWSGNFCTILVWNTRDDEIINKFKIDGRVIAGILSDNVLNLVSYCKTYRKLKIWKWNMTATQVSNGNQILNVDDWYDLKVSMSPDQEFVGIVGQGVENLCLWNIASNQIEIIGIHREEENWYGISWSPDSTRVATCSMSGKVSFWKVNKKECELKSEYDIDVEFSSEDTYDPRIDWSPDIAVPRLAVSYGEHIYLIDAKNGYGTIECTLRMKEEIFNLVWSPDGTRIAVALSYDFTIEIWSTNQSKCECELKGHTDNICSFSWLKMGTKLISGSYDKSVRIWSTKVEAQKSLTDHASVVEDDDSREDVASSHRSLDLFSPKHVDLIDLISAEQLLKYREKERIKRYEFVWFYYEKKLIVAKLETKYDDENRLNINFWNPETGKHLGDTDFHYSTVISLVENSIQSYISFKPNAKSASPIYEKRFFDDERIANTNDVIYVYEFDAKRYPGKWHENGRFAFGCKDNDSWKSYIFFFKLIGGMTKDNWDFRDKWTGFSDNDWLAENSKDADGVEKLGVPGYEEMEN